MTREPLCFWAWKKPPSSQKCTDQSSMNKPWLFKNLTLFRVYSIKRENPKKKTHLSFWTKNQFFFKVGRGSAEEGKEKNSNPLRQHKRKRPWDTQKQKTKQSPLGLSIKNAGWTKKFVLCWLYVAVFRERS